MVIRVVCTSVPELVITCLCGKLPELLSSQTVSGMKSLSFTYITISNGKMF